MLERSGGGREGLMALREQAQMIKGDQPLKTDRPQETKDADKTSKVGGGEKEKKTAASSAKRRSGGSSLRGLPRGWTFGKE